MVTSKLKALADGRGGTYCGGRTTGTTLLVSELLNCLQASLVSVEYDWVSLLKCDLGLSELGFRCLLFNRADMQHDDDATLDDTERRFAAVLRKKFDGNVVSDDLTSNANIG